MPRVFTVKRPVSRHGRLQHVVHRSRALGINKSFYLYVPTGRVTPANRGRYPVLYVFRGHQREWVNPFQDPSRAGRTILDDYEALVQSGRMGPMVLVFPGISSDDNTVSGVLTNMLEPERVSHVRGIGTGRFEDYFLDDLIPLVEADYPVLPGGAHRGVDGFSLGGLMAVKVALGYPGLFSSVGAYDGLYFYGKRLEKDKALRNPMFDAVFGVPRSLTYVVANSPAHLIGKVTRAELARMRWFIEYGPEASEPGDSNYYRGRDFVRQLSRRGIVNDGGVVHNGHHNWETADRHLARALPKHWAALRE